MLAMQVWFTQLVSSRLSLFWGHEGAQVELMETSVLLAGEALASLSWLPSMTQDSWLHPRHMQMSSVDIGLLNLSILTILYLQPGSYGQGTHLSRSW